MTSKAIPIELLSELTSECFVAALKRFASRRGLPKDMYSDNALFEPITRILRIAAKAPYFVRNSTLQRDLETDDLLDHIRNLTSKFLDSARQSKNPTVRVSCKKKFPCGHSPRRRRGPHAMTSSCTTSRTMG
ncbi:hypothetical protein HUJ04_012858 [Dendroctonus ponderosae]|nr:hypothetical protein HUJ04_012858 [Dendroctonus ponderosae]